MKISIVTINLNNLAGLRRTIESVRNQTYTDIEHIIIDGGSKDGSAELIEENKSKFSFCTSEPDSGIYNAMNKGIRKAGGEYCLFLNSGDYLLTSNILEKVAINLNEEDIIYGNGILIKNEESRTVNIPHRLTADFFYFNSLFHPSTFIKRELFGRYGMYDESYRIVSDWEFFVKTIIIHNVKTKYLNICVSAAEEGGVSSDRSNDFYIRKECDEVLKKYFSPLIITLLKDYKENEADLKWIRNKPLVNSYFYLRKIKKQLFSRKLKRVFTEVYENKFWGGETSLSGPGSDEAPTALIQKGITEIIVKRNIRSIIDAPCGDFLWMRNVIENCRDAIECLIGFDIVDEIVKLNNERYGNLKVKFIVKDLTESEVPNADMIICRDCFIHLSFSNILRILKNFKKSGSKYLLVSTYNSSSRRNYDIGDFKINFRALNLQKFPFSFGIPIDIINEGCQEFDGQYADKSLALYELRKINLVKASINLRLWNCRYLILRTKLLLKEAIYNIKN